MFLEVHHGGKFALMGCKVESPDDENAFMSPCDGAEIGNPVHPAGARFSEKFGNFQTVFQNKTL